MSNFLGASRFPRSVVVLSGIGAVTGLLVLMNRWNRSKYSAPGVHGVSACGSKNYPWKGYWREKLGGDPFYGDEQLTGRTVIITGTTSGMGKVLANQLAERGGRVLMACRDMEKCEKVRKEIIEMTFNKNVECKKLDLSSLKSIREFAEDINKTESRLDVLVNNAGVMCPPYNITEDGFELQLAVNYLGPFLLTNLLLDKLKRSKPSRIVNIGSIAYSQGEINFKDLNSAKFYKGTDAYSQSKLALVLFNTELTKRLEGTGVSTYMVCPGVVSTDLGRHMGISRSIISSFLLYPILWCFTLTPRQGIQATLHCILSEEAVTVPGKYWSKNETWPIAEVGKDEAVAHRLWAISERWTRMA